MSDLPVLFDGADTDDPLKPQEPPPLEPSMRPAAKGLLMDGYWIAVRDGDLRARALYRRHYSCRRYRDGRDPKLFVGPGEKMVLMTVSCDALLVWRKFISGDKQAGVNCSVFRNESPVISSILILEAMELAWRRWPGERLYTYVNPNKIRSTNPGCCFKKAGWAVCGKSKRGLVILEALPPAPVVAVEPGRAPDRDLTRRAEVWRRKYSVEVVQRACRAAQMYGVGGLGWFEIKTIKGHCYLYRSWRAEGRKHSQYIAPLGKADHAGR